VPIHRNNARQLAFDALQQVRKGQFADEVLAQKLLIDGLNRSDRHLITELVYGVIRRQRTLDALIDALTTKKSTQQPPNLQTILRLGIYQLSFLTQIPSSAAVNTAVELAKHNGLGKLSGVVNGVLRRFLRLIAADRCIKKTGDLPDVIRIFAALDQSLPESITQRLGVIYSIPDWIVEIWSSQLAQDDVVRLCAWMNQVPTIDLRINRMRSSVANVEAKLRDFGIKSSHVPGVPDALRFVDRPGQIQQLPGFDEGYWTVQDSSAQLVSHLLDPQPEERVIDACAAPGGKTTHIAELMGDRGEVWACDRNLSRLQRVKENSERLRLHSIRILAEDSRNIHQFREQADRVLVDAPCSGLGTLHRHVDARWRQTPETVETLAKLQNQLLNQAASWVKPLGFLVYSTCTLHPAENEAIMQKFLAQQPEWKISPPSSTNPASKFADRFGLIKIWPHQHSMDGFFMVRLQRTNS
jgi:16S rRNA (cytosine967-C5)-methyltransferase